MIQTRVPAVFMHAVLVFRRCMANKKTKLPFQYADNICSNLIKTNQHNFFLFIFVAQSIYYFHFDTCCHCIVHPYTDMAVLNTGTNINTQGRDRTNWKTMDRVDFGIDSEDEDNDLKTRIIGSSHTDGFKQLKSADEDGIWGIHKGVL